ncbi:glycosyl transferase family 2 [Roseimicrobium gellanilyticum]|uniref:Glycosyl transferase family 2 n=1 Tax=Roseimicrobium gellanilyticum TaxID=748857 RepID=A0A366H616_9BACT|nr:glycosyltransferase family A protein [Roseimicrobium gellanilyticum]RBP36663.1 glycosyl transferase family 2 [Roseimicrobium gellanilyticum]
MVPFTVLIPTLNRCGTLAHTLESCVVQQDENFRVVVSDNHSTDETRAVVESFQRRDPRVSYIRPPQQLSMSRNFEFLLEQVEDGFVMFLGSDDGMLPGAMGRARELLSKYPDALALHGAPSGIYFYPEISTDDAGLMYLRTTPLEELRSSHEWLALVAQCKQNVTQLPMPYVLSWIHHSVCQKIKAGSNRFIHSPIPDLFLGIAVAAQTSHYVSVCPGFTIGGISAGSNGTGTTHPKGDRSLEKTFKAQNEIPFHPKVGYTRSVPVLVGECMLQAAEAGLLPQGIEVAWDRIIARAWHQFRTEPWSESELQDNLKTLQFLASHVGGSDILKGATGPSSAHELVERFPFLLENNDGEWELVADTRALRLAGIHEAGCLAEALSTAAVRGANLGPSPTPKEISDWVMLEQGKQAATLRRQIKAAKQESGRRATERNRVKSQLAAAREKQEHLRKKLA